MLEALLRSTIAMAAPLLLAALGELLVEHSGVINVGIEGIMLTGAFAAMAGAYYGGAPSVGLLLAIVAAAILAAGFATIVVNVAVNQVVAGTALNIFALGLTGVLYRRLFGVTGAAFTVASLPIWKIPLLNEIPLIGPVLFQQNPLVYAALALVPLCWFALFRTRWGMELRASGERPEAADALGISVYRKRWQALLIAGVLTGLSGAYLTLAYTNTFIEGMSAGRGFVALALVILGRWRPLGVAISALLFGAAIALQFFLQASLLAIPYQLLLALPYLLTIAVLAIFKGEAESPGAVGEPYVRG